MRATHEHYCLSFCTTKVGRGCADCVSLVGVDHTQGLVVGVVVLDADVDADADAAHADAAHAADAADDALLMTLLSTQALALLDTKPLHPGQNTRPLPNPWAAQ